MKNCICEIKWARLQTFLPAADVFMDFIGHHLTRLKFRLQIMIESGSEFWFYVSPFIDKSWIELRYLFKKVVVEKFGFFFNYIPSNLPRRKWAPEEASFLERLILVFFVNYFNLN